MHLPLFLCLYESFWKGFESDQRRLTRGFNNFGDKRLFEVEQTAVIEKGP